MTSPERICSNPEATFRANTAATQSSSYCQFQEPRQGNGGYPSKAQRLLGEKGATPMQADPTASGCLISQVALTRLFPGLLQLLMGKSKAWQPVRVCREVSSCDLTFIHQQPEFIHKQHLLKYLTIMFYSCESTQ